MTLFAPTTTSTENAGDHFLMIPSDPLKMIALPEVVRRSEIPRKTILGWLAADAQAKTPGHRFPNPLGGHKLRWNERAFLLWMERHHAGGDE